MSLKLASVFGDHMVLQRDLPIRISGSALPHSRITLNFGSVDGATTADPAGEWRVELPALPASSEPRDLIVVAMGPMGEERVHCRDILVGEVWVCSGQSNMEWALEDTDDAPAEVSAATHPEIRLLTVTKRIEMQPAADLLDAVWRPCNPQTSLRFSAVGYFFARELHQKLNVPIGLINSSWGGTPAESWVSRQSLMDEPELRSMVDMPPPDKAVLEQMSAEYRKKLSDIAEQTTDAQNDGVTRGWANPAEPSGEWKEMVIPNIWQHQGLAFSGIVWFRKTVDIPASWAGHDLQLAIGATDKSDVTYFNGVQVGSVTMQQRNDSWSFKRTYTIPGALVTAGKAVIAVRVHSDKFDGGIRGPASAMHLSGPSGSQAISLVGTWQYAVEKNYSQVVMPPPPPAGKDDPNAPASLFNGMIHALLPLTIRGVIWYQGESNAGRSTQYRTLFPVLIQDWRKQWQRSDLAFHFVQLANFGLRLEHPADSDWARLREAQAMALRLPETGMAVAIDIGDAIDIHPRNKRDIGLRLARNALYQTFGKADVVPSGPIFREMRIEGPKAFLSFDYIAQGLTSHGQPLQGFAMAGADGLFNWATALIEGDSVIVTSDAVPQPLAVRYAWADNPACNLYSGEGLPAVPFRTDRWERS